MAWWSYSYKPYVSVAKRRANAAKEVKKLAKKGQTISPVNLSGRAIASTFWGKAWCDNLESYSDFENRLPRGRTYVRNGSVVDLQIGEGKITAMVSGSELYQVAISIKRLQTGTWQEVCRCCAGKIASAIELLQGRLSQGVMEVVTRPKTGLFPVPAEIEMNCSCPDWAGMCKHVAAALYGVGARLDEQPELLFRLRQVDHLDLVAQAGNVEALTRGSGQEQTIAQSDLGAVFGIELDAATPAPEPKASKQAKRSAAKSPPVKKKAKKTKKTATKRKAAGHKTKK